MMAAYSRCFAGSFGTREAFDKISEKPIMALSGVRSSWLMLARKRSRPALFAVRRRADLLDDLFLLAPCRRVADDADHPELLRVGGTREPPVLAGRGHAGREVDPGKDGLVEGTSFTLHEPARAEPQRRGPGFPGRSNVGHELQEFRGGRPRGAARTGPGP